MQDKITCGDTLRFPTTIADYQASDGWALKYRLIPRGIGATPINITPNPCRELANVSLASSLLSPHSSLSIYDASGRLVRTLEVRTSSFALRTAGLEPGAYFVHDFKKVGIFPVHFIDKDQAG